MSVKTRYKLLCGDVREKLKKIPDSSVQLCVTSPPYFGLRDYQTATWIGGDSACSHVRSAHSSKSSTLNGGKGGGAKLEATTMPFGDVCGRCGAKRVDKQIGIENTPTCGLHGLMRLRRDLTSKQRAFVVDNLLGVASRDARHGDSHDTE